MLEDAPYDLLCPGRRLAGIAPVLLPFTERGDIDWDGFAHLLGRAVDSALIPGLNLGPGAGALLDAAARNQVVATAQAAMGGSPFVAGVHVEPDGAGFRPERFAAAVDAVASLGAVPVLLPAVDTAALDHDELVGFHAWVGDWCDRYVVAELAPERWPGGRSWPLDVFAATMDQPACIGAVHGSGRRADEWDRLRARDEQRPDFQIFSANDAALDQVMYGADHLVDLAAAVPDALTARDEAWRRDDPAFVEANDALQALATMVFHRPAAEAQHALARVLRLRGWLSHDRVHPRLARRPASDDVLLEGALARVAELGLLD